MSADKIFFITLFTFPFFFLPRKFNMKNILLINENDDMILNVQDFKNAHIDIWFICHFEFLISINQYIFNLLWFYVVWRNVEYLKQNENLPYEIGFVYMLFIDYKLLAFKKKVNHNYNKDTDYKKKTFSNILTYDCRFIIIIHIHIFKVVYCVMYAKRKTRNFFANPKIIIYL